MGFLCCSASVDSNDDEKRSEEATKSDKLTAARISSVISKSDDDLGFQSLS